jgi:hypothetical protein
VPTELTFFERKVEDLAAFVGGQEVFWVAGGSGPGTPPTRGEAGDER